MLEMRWQCLFLPGVLAQTGVVVCPGLVVVLAVLAPMAAVTRCGTVRHVRHSAGLHLLFAHSFRQWHVRAARDHELDDCLGSIHDHRRGRLPFDDLR